PSVWFRACNLSRSCAPVALIVVKLCSASVGLQGRCAERERIAVVAQLVEQVALDRLARGDDVDPENPGGVLAKDLVLHLGRQLRETVLRAELFGYREGPKGFDLPIGRSDHRCIGTP